MGKAKRERLQEKIERMKIERKTMKELKIIELEEKFIYYTKLDMMKQDQ